jgi:glucosamine-6-phosphate deaminase
VRARVFPDYEAISTAVAYVVAGKLEEEPSTVFMLPTGITPLGMYERLVEIHRSGGLTFANATFFNLDEYLGLAPDHRASFHVYMKENFYDLIDADPARVFVPDGTAPDPEAECERYEAAIREAGGIDVCVLGIGRNGHIGFNEPGAPFDSRTRVVALSESTRKINASDFEADRAPGRAITVGMATIFDSQSVLLLASGTNKAGAVAAAVEDEVSESMPASMLRNHPNAVLFLDEAAASDLGHGVAG